MGPPRSGVNYTGVNQYKPDVAAPGASVVSQLSAGSKSINRYRLLGTDLQGKERTYLVYGGTSMSTPMVSGIVALMLQDNPFATPAQIKLWLTGATRAQDDYTGTLPNANWGYGKVDAQKAFNAVVSPTPTVTSAVIPAGTIDIPGIGVSRAVVVQGTGMAFTGNLYLDGQYVDRKFVYWLDHRRLVVAIADSASFSTLQVQSPKAPAGGQYSAVVNIALSSASQEDLQAALNRFKDVVPSSNVVASAPVASAPAQEGPGGGGGGGCFIATAAWGSPLEPHVVSLRQFRDRWLLTHGPGRAFVSLYYRWSPPVAAVIAERPVLRWATRLALTPVVLAVVHPAWAFMAYALVALAFVTVRRRRALAQTARGAR